MTQTVNKTILFTCGGTGGHTYPAIALAQALAQYKCFFVGSKQRQDKGIIEKYGYAFYAIPASAKSPIKWLLAYFKTRHLIKKNAVDLVISTGGYTTAPVILAAWRLKKPIMLLEQNVLPGRVNRLLQFCATRICVAFKESKCYFFQKDKVVVTGNPIRKHFLEDSTIRIIRETIINSQPCLLVLGGSQGAESINKLMESSYPRLLKHATIIHLTGARYYQNRFQDPVTIKTISESINHYIIAPYCEKMDDLYEQADFVICRAGATSIAELAYFKNKALVIPYPHAKDNHQEYNAKAFKQTGLGTYILEQKLTESLLEEAVLDWLKKPLPDQTLSNAREEIAALAEKMLL